MSKPQTDLRDVTELGEIIVVEPYLVLLPHPNNEHPDHRATSSFSRMAPTAGVSGAVLRARYLGRGGYSVESSTVTLALETVYFIER